jgi:hypothetical protein
MKPCQKQDMYKIKRTPHWVKTNKSNKVSPLHSIPKVWVAIESRYFNAEISFALLFFLKKKKKKKVSP